MTQRLEDTQNPIHILREHDPFEPGLLHRLPEPPRKIIALRASRIGDFINAMPAFQSLKAHLPHSQLTVITLPMLFDLAERCAAIDHVEVFPGYPGLADQLFDPRAALAFFQKVQSNEYDLAIQMQGSGVYANPFVLMLGARTTAGFIRPGDSPGRLDAALPIPDSGYEIDRVLAITTFLGVPAQRVAPTLLRKPEDAAVSEALLAGVPQPWIGLHASARDRTRRWSLERYSRTARQLQDRHGGTLIILGEERDRESVDSALDAMAVRRLNLAGRTSLNELIAVIGRLSVLLTNDTGPAHIAYALGVPAVVIFGAGDPTRNGPLSAGPYQVLAHPVPCRPCEYAECPVGYTCLENIHVEEVVDATEKLLHTPVQPS